MRRRAFLKTASAFAPIAGLPAFIEPVFSESRFPEAAVQSQPSVPTPRLHVVGAEEDLSGHPHSVGFSRILFRIITQQTDGRLFLIEHKNMQPGGPPLHFHLNQEEWFYVVEGELAFQVGEQRFHLHPGESVLAPRRVPHAFSRVGATPGHMIIAFTPAGKMEQFFENTADFHDLAAQAEHFRQYEMELVGPSPFLKP